MHLPGVDDAVKLPKRFTRWGNTMSHENLKVLLAQAVSPTEIEAAVKKSIEQGMPLHEIEQFLDWLEMNQLQSEKHRQPGEPRDASP